MSVEACDTPPAAEPLSVCGHIALLLKASVSGSVRAAASYLQLFVITNDHANERHEEKKLAAVPLHVGWPRSGFAGSRGVDRPRAGLLSPLGRSQRRTLGTHSDHRGQIIRYIQITQTTDTCRISKS